MTYEKFEHTVLKMLLAGDDPRLELLRDQIDELEVLAREETEMGFTVRLMAPASIAINESEGRIFGLEAKLTDTETINLELVLKDGLLDRLKGTFTSELSYADVITRGDELQFLYKNGKSAELNFHADDYDTGEVTFVKNITTISQEIDAKIVHDEEAEEFDDIQNIEDIEINEQEDVLVEAVEEEMFEEEVFEFLEIEPQTLFPFDETIDDVFENEVEAIVTKPVIDIESGPFAEPVVDYNEVCDGKAPQGPANFKLEEALVADEQEELAELDHYDTDTFEDLEDEAVAEETVDVEIVAAPQTGRGTGVLSSIDDEDVDEAIELLLKRNSAKRKDLTLVILITMITMIILALIIWIFFF